MKKLLFMLLCICMMISILSTALVVNAEADSKEMTFSYAYDVLRSPAFPEKIGAKVTIAGFKSPLKFGSSNISGVEHYESSKGKWKHRRDFLRMGSRDVFIKQTLCQCDSSGW